MILKQRQEPLELKLLKYLNARMKLTEKEINYFKNLKKGFEGEVIFDAWLEHLSTDVLILNDLLYEVNNTTFQIDSLVILAETIYLFEVKNFDSDYCIEGDNWKALSGPDVKNPIHQLKRNDTLFRRLLQELGYRYSVKPFLVFVNPNFFLYNAPLNEPIIYPCHLKRLINSMIMNRLPLKNAHEKLAEKLLSRHSPISKYSNLPSYSYEELNKGITCGRCHSYLDRAHLQKVLICIKCGYQEHLNEAILRSVHELNLLFPDVKLTSNIVYDWCRIIKSKKPILRVLSSNFKSIGHNKSTFYVDLEGDINI